MRTARSACVMQGVALIIVAGSAAFAADGTPLPVTAGLCFHLDAAATGVSAPAGGESGAPLPMPVWQDLSGQGRNAIQPDAAAQPQLLRVGNANVVRFDGDNDHFRMVSGGRSAEAVTLYLVAAARDNPGGFRAFVAANEANQRDYQSGFTVDLGPFLTAGLSQFNVEGRGFGGVQSLVNGQTPFGALRVFEIRISPSEKKVSVTVDGEPAGSRPWEPAAIHLEELTVGARYYNNAGPQQQVTGYLPGDIAEIALYDRDLPANERQLVREHLLSKHADLRARLDEVLPTVDGIPLTVIENPPAVQMFVPGFEVRELPLKLPNVNNVRCRPDGKLLALGYDGDVHLLTDSDGDGLYDQSSLFWDNPGRVRSPIGMALTPPGYARGNGVFVATKSECLLLADTDGDDKADTETTVATGWTESFHNVDALGVAVDPEDQSIYFGLGTANFSDPLVKDKAGQPTYRLDGERGTILKVAPDFQSREVFCTGIRFPVALAFDRHGELFASDQEGATWVPNGNPLDELLHIQRGRHYGFPARHPIHLPNVIDEPSVYDYGPQHQSTCGLTFNEPVVAGGPTFGPERWAGDALMAGYSRGKLYRTRLVTTPEGYVADTRLLACLNMLTVDQCVTTAGDLVIATHSGGPDWGSGPSGEGKLYLVRYEDREAPQPVAAWAASATEVHIAFDRPLNAEHLAGLAAETAIIYGEHVRAGDEFESLRPGYEVVARQMATPRRELPVHSAQVTPDRRTLILSTGPQSKAVHYAIRLPGLGRPDADDGASANAPLRQEPRVDLDYSLNGVAAEWTVAGAGQSLWLPHIDLDISKDVTAESAEHAALRDSTGVSGQLTLRTQLDLSHMLQPAVQPGSKLDYELPAEAVTLRLASTSPFRVKTPAGESVAAADADAGRFVVAVHHDPLPGEWLPLEVVLQTSTQLPDLHLSWSTQEDARLRAMPLHRFYMPWASRDESAAEVGPRKIPELAGGSWARGRKVFLSEAALCSKCHLVQGQGGSIGPDLSNLLHRDYASVRRDVIQPSYAINPDYIPHVVVLQDGRVLTGTLRNAGERVLVSDTAGKVTEVNRADIETAVASAKSIMPEGIHEKLPPEDFRDLLTYLLMAPPQMPLDNPQPPPPVRTKAELAAVLAGATEPAAATRPLNVVLVAGPKDHGPGEHDYPAWQEAWKELLSAADQTSVATAWEWPSSAQLETADVLVFYQQGKWTPERAKDIDGFLKRGGGVVYIHYAVDGGSDAPGFAQRIGLAWRGGASKFRHGPLELGFDTGADHSVGRNFATLSLHDESYWNLVGDPSKVRMLATGQEDNAAQPLFWTIEPEGGRVFVSIPGHYSWTFDDPLFRVLLLRGIAWSAREPVDRFNAIVPLGARLER
jgi:putative heme-binding domain-containing protein